MTGDMTISSWKQLTASSRAELFDYSQLLGTDFNAAGSSAAGKAQRIAMVSLVEGRLTPSEIILNFSGDGKTLYTVELGERTLWPGFAGERLRTQGISTDNARAVAVILLSQLLRQVELVQDVLDGEMSRASLVTHDFMASCGSGFSKGIDDMEEVDRNLAFLSGPESYVRQALFDLDNTARWLRRQMEGGSAEALLLEEMLLALDGVTRRVEFALERQRFHWESASSAIMTSMLSINKLFNVLWAIIIPGTILINWYGENFRFMPELSWAWTMPSQLMGVFVMTILPLWIVKRSGAMR